MDADKRIPSLDGIRAIAILLIVYQHLWFPTHGDLHGAAFDWGTLGVYIFFVLSGFLITAILQREQERMGSVSLSNFYVRRFFRIFPSLLGVTLILMRGAPVLLRRTTGYSFRALGHPATRASSSLSDCFTNR